VSGDEKPLTQIGRMDTNRNSAWFQFKLRDIFLATFCAALWCGAFVANFESVGRIVVIFILIKLYVIIGPFVAIGALFGRPGRGAIVGLIALGLLAVVDYIAISNGWVDFP
jgi:hypothetical protein